MRIYTVHVDPVSSADDRGAVLVRESFCWPAALFTVFWALSHRLWGWALVLVVISIGFGAAAAWWGVDPVGQAGVLIGFVILVGYNANDWRRGGLARRGYLLADVVAGPDLAAAEQRFFDRVSATAP